MIKDVISADTGEKVKVDTDKAIIYSYNNRQRRIVKSAEIIERGRPSGFYATYLEEGTVDNVRDRLSTWDNTLKLGFAAGKDFNSENNPDDAEYEYFVRSIEKNADRYFDEYGDFYPEYVINVQALIDCGFYSDEPLIPMGYISLAEYCEKYGYNMRSVRRKLSDGKMKGLKLANSWFLLENEPYHYTRAAKKYDAFIQKYGGVVASGFAEELAQPSKEVGVSYGNDHYEYIAAKYVRALDKEGVLSRWNEEDVTYAESMMADYLSRYYKALNDCDMDYEGISHRIVGRLISALKEK